MKKIITITLVILSIGFTVQAQDKCQGWQKAGSMGREAQISINICERASGGSGYVTLRNNSDKSVKVSYEIHFNSGKSIKGRTPIKPHSETSSSCFSCAEKNGGGIKSCSIYNIVFEGEARSSSSDSSSPQGNSNQNSTTSSWDEDESLLGDEDDYSSDSGNSYNYTEESIYQKRQREARQAKERKLAHRRAEEKRVKDAINRQNRANAQMERKAQQNINNWNNMWDKAADVTRANQEKKWAQMKRAREQQAAEYRRKEEERARLQKERQREWERKETIKKHKTSFMHNLKDEKIPLFYEHSQAFVLCVSKINEEKIKFIPVLLYKNTDNQLPYKQDIINAIKKDKNVSNVKVHGVYASFEELKQVTQNLYANAKQSYVTVEETSRLEFGKPQANSKQENGNNEDFWGNKKSKTKNTKKTKKNDDFWD